MTLEDLRTLHTAFDESFYESLQTAAVLAMHDVIGGTAPGRVRQGIMAAKKKIESLREEINFHAHA